MRSSSTTVTPTQHCETFDLTTEAMAAAAAAVVVVEAVAPVPMKSLAKAGPLERVN